VSQKRISLTLLMILLFMGSRTVIAQELSFLGGVMQDIKRDDNSYSWQLEYKQRMGEYFSYSLSYLNEGHIPQHHRDGHTLQLWTHSLLLDRRLSLGLGAGPFYYFDTTAAKAGASYANDHGWGTMVSFAATWYTQSRLLFLVQANLVATGSGPDTVSTLAGIGYQLDATPVMSPLASVSRMPGKTSNNEITLFAGRTIVNSFRSEQALSGSLEYRRKLWPYLEGTVAWLYEGDKRLTRRDGVTTQLWAVREFSTPSLALGIGGGAYFNIDRYRDERDRRERARSVSGIVTLSASYRLTPDWALRTSWNRIVTSYNRDTDVIMGGIGYRF